MAIVKDQVLTKMSQEVKNICNSSYFIVLNTHTRVNEHNSFFHDELPFDRNSSFFTLPISVTYSCHIQVVNVNTVISETNKLEYEDAMCCCSDNYF